MAYLREFEIAWLRHGVNRGREILIVQLTLWQDTSISRDLLRIAFQYRDELRKNMFATAPEELRELGPLIYWS